MQSGVPSKYGNAEYGLPEPYQRAKIPGTRGNLWVRIPPLPLLRKTSGIAANTQGVDMSRYIQNARALISPAAIKALIVMSTIVIPLFAGYAMACGLH